MKSSHELLAEKANQDLKSNDIDGCNVLSGFYDLKGKLTEQIRISSSTPQSLLKAKQVLSYIKWTDLSPTLAVSGDGL